MQIVHTHHPSASVTKLFGIGVKAGEIGLRSNGGLWKSVAVYRPQTFNISHAFKSIIPVIFHSILGTMSLASSRPTHLSLFLLYVS